MENPPYNSWLVSVRRTAVFNYLFQLNGCFRSHESLHHNRTDLFKYLLLRNDSRLH